jgi:hypothetical protein
MSETEYDLFLSHNIIEKPAGQLLNLAAGQIKLWKMISPLE